MLSLPSELIYRICKYLNRGSIKELRLVNKRINDICRDIIFKNPNLKKPIPMDFLVHLPIRILRNSQINGEILHLPPSTSVVILDSRTPRISPQFISKYPDINFVLAVNHLRGPRVFHHSNFLLPNVKLFSTKACPLWYSSLMKYKDFTFQHIIFSHIEHHDREQKEIFNILSQMKIERLVMDHAFNIEPEQLTNFKNIVHISSRIFQPTFPTDLCNKLPNLEIICIHRGTIIDPDYFKQFRTFFSRKRSHAFSNDLIAYKNGVASAKCRFSVHIKSNRSPWILSLEKGLVNRRLLLF